MAAFERVSTVTIHPHDRNSAIDIRSVRLPGAPSRLSLPDRDAPREEEYDPRAHRIPPSRISPWMAYFNLIRTGFGAGLLGMPLAMSQSGIVLGPILAMSTGLLVMHTHLMLLNSLNEVSKQLKIPYISYRYGFRIALLHGPPIMQCIGSRGPTIIAVFMLMSQVGICTVFVDFTADSLRDIMDWQSVKTAMLALVLPYLLLEFFMKTLAIVSYISMFGNFMNVAGVALIFYHIFSDPQKELIYYTTEPLPLLLAIGTFLFNLSAVGVILTIDKALEHPVVMVKRFGIVTMGILIPTIVATIFGTLGYWSFGTMEENVIRSLPYDDDTTMAAAGLYLFTVALSYPLQCYPAIQIVLEIIKNYNVYYEPPPHTLKLIEIIARPTFVFLTFLIAYVAPFQGPFVAFVGNLCTTMLALVFPAMMDISLMYPGPYGKYNIYLIKNILIILIGLTSCCFGVVFCLYLIYVRVMASRSPNDTDYFR